MIIKNLKKLILIIFIAYSCLISNVLCLASFAEEPFSYNSPEILGMGGVSLIPTEDKVPLVYNPGGLAYLDRMRISAGLFSFGLNKDILDFYNLYKEDEMKDILDGKKDWEDASPDLRSKMLTHRIGGLRIGSDLNVMFPIKAVGNFGVGIYGDVKGTIETDKGIYVPTAGLNYRRDFLIVASYARKYKLPVLEDYLEPFAFGLNLKYLQRQKMNDFRTLVEYEEFSFTNLLHKGWGIGVDFGMAYKMFEDRLGFALVWKDCGNTTLKWDNQDSTQILSRANLGVAYKPEKLYYWRDKYISVNDNLILACDIKKIGRYEDFFKRLNLGARLNFWGFSLSGGFNQGYLTFGAGVKLGLAHFNYAYYGVERGVFAGQDVDWNQTFSLSVMY